jgi:hypothetical protein
MDVAEATGNGGKQRELAGAYQVVFHGQGDDTLPLVYLFLGRLGTRCNVVSTTTTTY